MLIKAKRSPRNCVEKFSELFLSLFFLFSCLIDEGSLDEKEENKIVIERKSIKGEKKIDEN